MRNGLLVFLISGLTSFYGCQPPDERVADCSNVDVQVLAPLKNRFDKFFPYSEQSKSLRFLFNSETAENDTVVFELVRYDTVDIDTIYNEGFCFINLQETRLLVYKSKPPYTKWMQIIRHHDDSYFSCDIKPSSAYFKDYGSYDFWIGPNAIYTDSNPDLIPEFANEVGDTFSNLAEAVFVDYYHCPGENAQCLYNKDYGFVKIYYDCHKEDFQLLK